MSSTKHIKMIREGHYLAEVEVELHADGSGWSPYLSPEDACRLDDVRDALRRGDLKAAARLARVFRVEPVTAP